MAHSNTRLQRIVLLSVFICFLIFVIRMDSLYGTSYNSAGSDREINQELKIENFSITEKSSIVDGSVPIDYRIHQNTSHEGFSPGTITTPEHGALQYRIRYNRTDETDGPWPLLLFLHGAGQRGEDNIQQLTHLAPLFEETGPLHDKPAIVVAPQSPTDRYWVDVAIRQHLMDDNLDTAYELLDQPPVREMELIMALVDSLVATGDVDQSRMYVTGLSMGGFGTFDLLARRPGTFAAAIPICAGGHPRFAEKQGKRTAIWITHGAEDEVVTTEFSRNSYRALKEAGANVRYTEFPETGHFAWEPTYAIPGIFDWMFDQRLD